MRWIDGEFVRKISLHWCGRESDVACPAFESIDSFLALLDGNNITPGHAFTECPLCGSDHRWTVLSNLIVVAAQLRTKSQHRLFLWAREQLAAEYAYHGGKEAYDQFVKDANDFYSKLQPGRFY